MASPVEDGPDLRFDNKAAVRALELIDPPPAASPPTAAFSRAHDSLNAVELINLVGREGHGRPRQFRTVGDAILRRLQESPRRYRPHDVRQALREHGFLAGVLQANESADEEYQVRALHEFLLAAYPAGLSQPAILRVLTEAGSPPTPALLAAVSLCLSSPADIELAQQAYIHGWITRMSLDASTYVRLAPYIPDVSRASTDAAATEP